MGSIRYAPFCKICHGRYKCPECDMARIQKATIRSHYEAYHANSDQEYECLICATKYSSYIRLRLHIKRSHTNRKFPCSHCDMTLSCKNTLRVHIARIHKEKEEPIIRPRPYICDDCGSSFLKKRHLVLHMDSHSATKKYYCIECDKYFGHRSTLNAHYRMAEPHVKNQDLPHKCPECGKGFGQKSLLTRHFTTVHAYQLYKCDQCDKVYKAPRRLLKHKKVAHSGYKAPKIFECSNCDKKFTTKQAMKHHQTVHTGERPFACTKCTATFAHNSTLYHHNNLVHLKKKRNRDVKRASNVKKNVGDQEYDSEYSPEVVITSVRA